MKTLDSGRAFGEICGSPSATRARYEQDGILFDADGNALNCVEPDVPETIETEPLLPRLPDAHDVDDEAIVMGLVALGKDKKQIARETGIHHKRVGKIIRSAQSKTYITME